MPDPKLIDHQVYYRNLLPEDKGFTPWFPGSVNIAEVGYIHDGQWNRLFDASKEPGDDSNHEGVPDDYYPLVIGKVIQKKLCNALPFARERGTALQYGMKVSGDMPLTPSGGPYRFKSSKQEGAILVTGDIEIQDVEAMRWFIEYIRGNCTSWRDFANDKKGLSLCLIDLVLVTGWHKTSSWACAAFAGCSSEVSLEFNVDVGGITGGSVWGTWLKPLSPGSWAHSGPERASPGTDDGKSDSHPSPRGPMDSEGSSDTRNDNVLLPSIPTPNIASGSEPMKALQHWGKEMVNRQETIDRTKDLKPLQDQGIFIRGFKICDKHTALARIFCRKLLEHCDDGFIHIPPSDKQVNPRSGKVGDRPREDRDKDKDKDGEGKPPGPGSHQDPSSGSPDNSLTSSKDKGRAHFSLGGASDRNTSPSDSSNMDFSALGLEIDEDLALYLQLNCNKMPTAVEITLEYILENSEAEFAIVHDNDVMVWLKSECAFEDLFSEIQKIRPQIFLVDQIGMLEISYSVTLDNRYNMEHVDLPSFHTTTAQSMPVPGGRMVLESGGGKHASLDLEDRSHHRKRGHVPERKDFVEPGPSHQKRRATQPLRDRRYEEYEGQTMGLVSSWLANSASDMSDIE
ncbi:hypothetical protein JB92DRAFT_3116659 [Gautieria morchelliformis]|nr:hypothetical protein JB92DRAFT_3116659 [Gautieria morchelliformis]